MFGVTEVKRMERDLGLFVVCDKGEGELEKRLYRESLTRELVDPFIGWELRRKGIGLPSQRIRGKSKSVKRFIVGFDSGKQFAFLGIIITFWLTTGESKEDCHCRSTVQ